MIYGIVFTSLILGKPYGSKYKTTYMIALIIKQKLLFLFIIGE